MKKVLHYLGYIISIVLFAAALWVIHYKLQNYHYHDIVRQIAETPRLTLLAAIVLTFINYLFLTGYDLLAVRYAGLQLKYSQLAAASFISYAFSMNATFLGGSAARYRVYSSLGVSAANIARLVLFCAITFWLGLFAIGALAFLVRPEHIPEALHVPVLSARPLGFIFLAIVLAYFALVAFGKRPLQVRGWVFERPTVPLALGQLLVSALDWALAACVLYALLPQSPELTYMKFLSLFLLAQTAGMFSFVPGGLGVFETVILLLLANYAEPAALLGSLLMYRLIYYLLPLLSAVVMLGLNEFLTQRQILKQFGRLFVQFGKTLVPLFFAISTFIAGAVLLFSGSLPAVKGRMAVLRDFLPLPAVEVSHFLGSVAGAALLILAHGLQRRLAAAYHLTVALLAAGILFSLAKGLDYEEATILAVMLLALAPCGSEFYRKASLTDEQFSLGWILSIIAVVACSVWLGIFSYRHVEYSEQLWWRFAMYSDAPRFLRATAAAVTVLLLFFLMRLHLPGRMPGTPSASVAMETIERIVVADGDTGAWLALLGDKRFLINPRQTAFLMYGVEGRSWISLGEPVGPRDEWADLVWRFREVSDRHNGWPVFYQLSKEHLDLYLDLGLMFVKLGEEAWVDLQQFSLSGASRGTLRHTRNKLEKTGCSFSILEPPQVTENMEALGAISDGWLKEKHTREKRFSLGYFNRAYLSRMPAAVIRMNERIAAFANILQSADRKELSVDLMRFVPEGPDGLMDYLFIELMLWGKEQGFEWFNFGMAPLSGFEDRALAPLWAHAGAFLFRHGEHFYNFQGLRQYKEKWGPEWRPKYLACTRSLRLPIILTNVASLVSGDIRGVIAK